MIAIRGTSVLNRNKSGICRTSAIGDYGLLPQGTDCLEPGGTSVLGEESIMRNNPGERPMQRPIQYVDCPMAVVEQRFGSCRSVKVSIML
jgi:hypothetical protein